MLKDIYEAKIESKKLDILVESLIIEEGIVDYTKEQFSKIKILMKDLYDTTKTLSGTINSKSTNTNETFEEFKKYEEELTRDYNKLPNIGKKLYNHMLSTIDIQIKKFGDKDAIIYKGSALNKFNHQHIIVRILLLRSCISILKFSALYVGAWILSDNEVISQTVDLIYDFIKDNIVPSLLAIIIGIYKMYEAKNQIFDIFKHFVKPIFKLFLMSKSSFEKIAIKNKKIRERRPPSSNNE